MSTNTLHQIANNDTPAVVTVPKDMQGLIVWAVGRFGGGILLAAACAWALSKVYDDHAKQTDRMMTLLEVRSKTDSELALAIRTLALSVDEIGKEARAAHTGINQALGTNSNKSNRITQ